MESELDPKALESAWLAHDNACPGEHWRKRDRMAAGIRAYLSALAPAPSQPGTQPGQTEKLGKSVSEEGNNVSGTAEQIVAEPVAWQYRWKLDGEWTDWRVSDHSQKASGLKDLEERPLYASPSQPDGESVDKADAWDVIVQKNAEIARLKAGLEEIPTIIKHGVDHYKGPVAMKILREVKVFVRSLLNGEKGRG